MDDVIGSPYAVTNYTCNPELGSDDDILGFKQKVNGMGLKLMLDFVPNHR
jgi:glycosidase